MTHINHYRYHNNAVQYFFDLEGFALLLGGRWGEDLNPPPQQSVCNTGRR